MNLRARGGEKGGDQEGGVWYDFRPHGSHKLFDAQAENLYLTPSPGIPGFPGAHSQGETLDQLNENLREVIAMLLEDGEPRLEAEFLGMQTVTVP